MLASCALSSLISLGSEACLRRALLGFRPGRRQLALPEWGPQGECLLEHRHVLASLLLIGLERRRRIGECRRELRAEFLLLLDEVLQAELQVARHHAADAVVIETDQLAQEWHRQECLAADAVLLLDDDLGQHRMREVVARLGVIDDEIPDRRAPSPPNLRASHRCSSPYYRDGDWHTSL